MKRNAKSTVCINMKTKLILISFLSAIMLSSCSLFKKKCDCPDHKRAKRIAELIEKRAFFEV